MHADFAPPAMSPPALQPSLSAWRGARTSCRDCRPSVQPASSLVRRNIGCTSSAAPNKLRPCHRPFTTAMAQTEERGAVMDYASEEMPSTDQQTSVLFVCLGNICRSPSAEAVFKSCVERRGLSHTFVIDSCGLGGGSPGWYKAGGWSHHMGYPADERMMEAASRRSIELTSHSRPMIPDDLTKADHILAMDYENVASIQAATDHWASEKLLPPDYRSKVKLLCSYCRTPQFKDTAEVPDPYFGGRKGFELVLDILEDACEGLLDAILAERAGPGS